MYWKAAKIQMAIILQAQLKSIFKDKFNAILP